MTCGARGAYARTGILSAVSAAAVCRAPLLLRVIQHRYLVLRYLFGDFRVIFGKIIFMYMLFSLLRHRKSL